MDIGHKSNWLQHNKPNMCAFLLFRLFFSVLWSEGQGSKHKPKKNKLSKLNKQHLVSYGLNTQTNCFVGTILERSSKQYCQEVNIRFLFFTSIFFSSGSEFFFFLRDVLFKICGRFLIIESEHANVPRGRGGSQHFFPLFTHSNATWETIAWIWNPLECLIQKLFFLLTSACQHFFLIFWILFWIWFFLVYLLDYFEFFFLP